MKELTIEEKAKRYDEAIEIARKIKDGESVNTPDGTVIPVVIFPELKEDEDDRIGKVIIEHFVDSHSCIFPYKGFTKEQIIDWLEKQCEKECEKEWDEEDERKVKDIIYFLNSAKVHYASDVELNGCIKWLWSLIQRMGQ